MASSSISEEDITTVAEFEEYLRENRNICPSGDSSDCPDPDQDVCINSLCYRTCNRKKDCLKKTFTCTHENLCKPEGCKPCKKSTDKTTPPPLTKTEQDPNPETSITTEDEFEAYLRKQGTTCPSGDVSECPRPKQSQHVCLGGNCYKTCLNDGDCNGGYICNFENLCKPPNCRPCIRKTLYPTPLPTASPPDYDYQSQDELEATVLASMGGAITTEDEFDTFMADTRNTCPSGKKSECPRPPMSVCLNYQCFKKCSADTDCPGYPEFTCNWEGLCKPEGCTPCQRNTMYPTPQPPQNMELLNKVEMGEQQSVSELLSSALMIAITGSIIVGLFIFSVWLCRKVYLWAWIPKKNSKEYQPSKYGSNGSTVIQSV